MQQYQFYDNPKNSIAATLTKYKMISIQQFMFTILCSKSTMYLFFDSISYSLLYRFNFCLGAGTGCQS